MEQDLQDGLLFAALLEELTSSEGDKKAKKMGKLNPKPVFKIQKVNNLAVVFNFIKEQGIRLENMGPEDVANGNLKMVLGLLWTLISHYQVRNLGGGDEHSKSDNRKLVLGWINKIVGALGFSVSNFTHDFQDGKVLAAIIYSYQPDLVDMDAIHQNEALENAELALSCLERHFDVPHIVDAQDIVNSPDEKSMLTFLNEMIAKLNDLEPSTASGEKFLSFFNFF